MTLSETIPIWFARPDTWDAVRDRIGDVASRFAEASGFEPKPGRIQLIPASDGGLAGVIFADDPADPFSAGKLATALPKGNYRLEAPIEQKERAALAFQLALYRFEQFKSAAPFRPSLAPDGSIDFPRIEKIASAVAFGRDLINMPANALTPSALEREATNLAVRHGARISIVTGDDLTREFPLIAAVGAAASEPARLVDFVWGRAAAAKVTLVGKGVVFNSGGLDIKPANGMELMKKDMGGAATALVLARLIMEERLDVRLRVLLPIVENAISASAMRPGDIYRSRNGLTVEIGNTDAEGRLILADALALAAEESPDLLLDFATLTGAARVALGPELPPFYTDDDALAQEIAKHAAATNDPVWRMPLWRGYNPMLDTPFADLNNSPGSPFAGSITAALFLQRFVDGAKSWAHFDVYAWNPKPRSSGPQGGEIQAARALASLIAARSPTREEAKV